MKQSEAIRKFREIHWVYNDYVTRSYFINSIKEYWKVEFKIFWYNKEEDSLIWKCWYIIKEDKDYKLVIE